MSTLTKPKNDDVINLQHLGSPEMRLKALEESGGCTPRSDDADSPIAAVARYWAGTQKSSEGLPEMLILRSDERVSQAGYFGHTMFPGKIKWNVSNMNRLDLMSLYKRLDARLSFLEIAVVFATMDSVEGNTYIQGTLEMTQELFGPDRVFILADDWGNKRIIIDSLNGSLYLKYNLGQMKEAQNIVAECISQVIHPNLKDVLMPPGQFRKPKLVIAPKFPYVRIKKNYPYNG